MTDQKIMEQLKFIMDNMATKEDLASVEARMATKEDLAGVEARMAGVEARMASVEARMATKEDLAGVEARFGENLREAIYASETRINIKIENEITAKLDALFDGYHLNRDKQQELERRVERLERAIDDLRSRIA